MLKFYTGFEINDQTGNALTQKEMTTLHYDRITSLQVNGDKLAAPRRSATLPFCLLSCLGCVSPNRCPGLCYREWSHSPWISTCTCSGGGCGRRRRTVQRYKVARSYIRYRGDAQRDERVFSSESVYRSVVDPRGVVGDPCCRPWFAFQNASSTRLPLPWYMYRLPQYVNKSDCLFFQEKVVQDGLVPVQLAQGLKALASP